MHDVFISYSRKDKQTATIILSKLEQQGIRCWIDYRDALPGAEYAASIVHAIKSAKCFVLLLSSNSSQSPHVLNEINSGVNACIPIIPFKIDETELNESMEYYLGKTHWLEAVTPPLEAHINELAQVLGKHIGRSGPTGKPEPVPHAASDKDIKKCRMLKFEDLLALGYTSASIAVQLVENDYINCNGIGQENEGTAEQWEACLQDNSDTFQYLINGADQIVGDWSIVALTDEAFADAMKGELLEADIDIEKTNLICFPDVYNGYILAFSILPQYRNRTNYNLIIDSFLRQLEEYSENGIFFRSWCINVFSKEVEALVRQLGFKYVCNNKVYGKIYSCPFMPLPNLPLFKKYPKLVENYANM